MTHRHLIRGRHWAMVAVALALAGCGPAPTPTPTATPTDAPRLTAVPTEAIPFAEGLTVTITDQSFQPAALAVAAHSTIIWTNADDQEHSVTQGEPGAPTGFDSNFLEPNATFSFTFEQPGDYVYFCRIHNEMRGVIRVVP